MTLDKLHRNQIAGIGQVVWPTYMVFKERLVLKKFDDIKIVHGTHNDFKQTIRHDMEEHGLLCPMVIDQDDQLRNGNHRFKILKKDICGAPAGTLQISIAIIVENKKYYCAPCMLRKEGIVPLTNSMIFEKKYKD